MIIRRLKFLALVTFTFCISCGTITSQNSSGSLKASFISPPDSSRPGVYWYFMDGNLSKEAMTADLESMKQVGIGTVLFLEVNVGVPRGKVDFLSEEWQNFFAHAVAESERLGIELVMGSGPGWAGSGGPWVTAKQSMRHLVASEVTVNGPKAFNGALPVPAPRLPYFGIGALTTELRKLWDEYYEDTFVLAFPTPEKEEVIVDADEKAIYYRAPYTSVPNVKPYLAALADYGDVQGIDMTKMIDLTSKLDANGVLKWDVPQGKWTIMRMGTRNNGAVTRPAPMPGLGFEVDKFDTIAFNVHFEKYLGNLLEKTGGKKPEIAGGWTMLHIDSWEMGAQNWTDNFREEFAKRRSYDPLKYFPAYTGKVVDNLEVSERFLWDVRQTGMELILENHAGHLRNLGKRYGFKISIEPYDMNPNADLDLGAVADVPMCEFWTKGVGYNSSFSCIEATSIAHVHGRPVVGAESFTTDYPGAWKLYPENVKNQGDWAFCIGINKFMYHTFAHKPLDDNLRPGMTMGPYGVHWDRGQTWWPLASAYHQYVTRCQHVLRQGVNIADILYLTPEGAPHVFRAPASALSGDDFLPDKRGYNFDGCSPLALIEKADVKHNRIVFPGGASYRVMVLPSVETMTPELLQKIEFLVNKGATIIGKPPVKSPSLTNYPDCDKEVKELSMKMWGDLSNQSTESVIKYGQGVIYSGGKYTYEQGEELYTSYDVVAGLLQEFDIEEDFSSETGMVRYIHKVTEGKDVYFISNKTDSSLEDVCNFRSMLGAPELWDPVTGEIRVLKNFTIENGVTSVPMKFDKTQSFFVVFDKANKKVNPESVRNFPEVIEIQKFQKSWDVSFNPRWGGPEKVTFDKLTDWSQNDNEGIRYYSGSATYVQTFDYVGANDKELFLDLGNVKNIARVTLNGKELGIVWTSPWRAKITEPLKKEGNTLEIEVINLWANRLIGDEFLPDDGIKGGRWPEWLLKNTPRTSGRYTFTTNRYYKKDHPLLESGLMGPVRIVAME